ncbi:Exonuclease [Exaiptasia diaphana]|nr:Exonuclease [Exaiptasia diaphana]
MKQKSYKVTIYLDEINSIKSTECECPRGEFKCSHAAAVFIHGLWWVLSPEPPTQAPLPIPTIEELIFCEDFLEVVGKEHQIAYIQDKAKVSANVIEVVAELTMGQRDNSSWHLARRGRLTASNFGSVLNCKRVTPSLLKRLLGEYDLSRVKAVQWGTNNEKEAINYFKTSTGLQVAETGLWLHESGVLGASPDGLIGNCHVLEVKCPYTERNEAITDAIKNASFCLKEEDGKLIF